jgi:hypothetical protein
MVQSHLHLLCRRHVGVFDRGCDLLPDWDSSRGVAMDKVTVTMIITGVAIGMGAYGLIMLGQYIAEKLL